MKLLHISQPTLCYFLARLLFCIILAFIFSFFPLFFSSKIVFFYKTKCVRIRDSKHFNSQGKKLENVWSQEIQ